MSKIYPTDIESFEWNGHVLTWEQTWPSYRSSDNSISIMRGFKVSKKDKDTWSIWFWHDGPYESKEINPKDALEDAYKQAVTNHEELVKRHVNFELKLKELVSNATNQPA